MIKKIMAFAGLLTGIAAMSDDHKVNPPAWPNRIKSALSFYQPFDTGPDAAYAKGSPKGDFSSDHFPYDFYLQDGVRSKALVVEGGNLLKYRTEHNIDLNRGSICFWIRPLFDWTQKVGRIPFDMRYEKDNIMPHPDPSQRMGLTYNIKKGRAWRFFISVDRNYYLPGSKIRRDDKANPRSRFYVGSGPQHFQLGEWQHVALTWGKKRAAIYLNGVLEGENVLNDGGMTKLPEHFQIGAKASWINANALSHIDEFCIFNRPLNAEEIRRIYESYGGRAASVPKTVSGSPKLLFREDFSRESPTGSPGSRNIVKFNGRPALKLSSGKHLDYPAAGKLSLDRGSIRLRVVPEFNAVDKGKITWFRAATPGTRQAETLIEISYPLSYRNFGVNFSNRGKLPAKLNLETSGQYIFSGSHRFKPGRIFDLVFCWDRGYGSFYVNGKLEGKVKLNDGVPAKLPEVFSLGTADVKKSSLPGMVLGVEIYDGPLSPETVKRLYLENTK